jgi:hypothetical protein
VADPGGLGMDRERLNSLNGTELRSFPTSRFTPNWGMLIHPDQIIAALHRSRTISSSDFSLERTPDRSDRVRFSRSRSHRLGWFKVRSGFAVVALAV